MATLQKKQSRGQTYWYIVESRRVNGKPRPVVLAYLGKPEDLLIKMRDKGKFEIKSYSHADSSALLKIAHELRVVDIINKHLPQKKSKEQIRDGLSVGATLLLAAIGRACCPTSKLGWYDWCKTTSMEYCLKASFKHFDSQHFWDQMNLVPEDKITKIEEELFEKMIDVYKVKPELLYFDTTNFFTFIDSMNTKCTIAKRGKNKQKRYDLRQFSLALLVTKEDQLPIFHKTYEGNKNDVTLFKEVFTSLRKRVETVSKEIIDVTIVFDKGNNSKLNFASLDSMPNSFYIASLISSHFKDLITTANEHFEEIKLGEQNILAYRTKYDVWGTQKTCVVFVSEAFKQGQYQGLMQSLNKKYVELDAFKKITLGSKKFTKEQVQKRIESIIKAQYVKDVIGFEIFSLNNKITFTYFINFDNFIHLRDRCFGRQILVTNRDSWTSQDIISAYNRKSDTIEFAFRNLKNPYHLAVRPQFHWTDQKIVVHTFICMLSYLLASCTYAKVKKLTQYKRSMDNFFDDLKNVRLASVFKKSSGKNFQVQYLLENVPPDIQSLLDVLDISNATLRKNMPFSVYT